LLCIIDRHIESLNPKSSWNVNWNHLKPTCDLQLHTMIFHIIFLPSPSQFEVTILVCSRRQDNGHGRTFISLVLSFDGIVWLHEQFACLLCRPACDRPLLRNCGARREHVWFVFICSWVFCTWWYSSSLWQCLWGLSNEWKSSPTLDALQKIAKYASPCMVKE
jgi:hypothetical protein